MGDIRPIIRRFPTTANLLSESNLPFSCVVTPYNDSRDDGEQHRLPLVYGVPKCNNCGAPHPTNETCFRPAPFAGEEAPFLVCYFCGRKTILDSTSSSSSKESSSVSRGDKKNNNNSFSTTRKYQASLVDADYTNNDNGSSSSSRRQLIQLPAILCPPVWWIILDGCCTERSYWSNISIMLSSIIEDIPDFVHIGILITSTTTTTMNNNNNNNGMISNGGGIRKRNSTANGDNNTNSATTKTMISYLDLTSPSPHMLHFSYNNLETLRYDNYSDMVQKITLVPCDSIHKSNIHAAVRSLVDFDPPCTDEYHESMDAADTNSMPLGKTIEIVLDIMDGAEHPGMVSDDNDNKNNKTNAIPKNRQQRQPPRSGAGKGTHTTNSNNLINENRLLYAGGKISCFLTGQPTEVQQSLDGSCNNTNSNSSSANNDNKRRSLSSIMSGFMMNSNNDDLDTTSSTIKPTIGAGGFGGSVLRGIRNQKPINLSSYNNSNGSNQEEEDVTDMTPSNLYRLYGKSSEEIVQYFRELGSHCADAALGVDLYVLVESEDETNDYNNNNAEGPKDYTGLPLFRILSDRSGAPGPLIFPLKEESYCDRLKSIVASRAPCFGIGNNNSSTKVVYGCELRMRISDCGYCIDTSPVDKNEDEIPDAPQLASHFSDVGGLMGPASTSLNKKDKNLWKMGTCDPYTSFTVDLDLVNPSKKGSNNDNNDIVNTLVIDGFGEIVWKPVIQTSFAYTTIVYNQTTNQYITQRRVDISHTRVKTTNNLESMYSSIDPEALAAVLFHKLSLTVYRDGLHEAQIVGQDWLLSLLLGCYKSAEIEHHNQMKREENNPYQPEDSNNSGDGSDSFYSAERLIDRIDNKEGFLEKCLPFGELSVVDVLLGQGHSRVKNLPLIMYTMLQCDAIRPPSWAGNNSSSYQPSMDARCAALSQMSSMNPGTISKCIAPKLQLFSLKEGLLQNIVDLNIESIRYAVSECNNDKNDTLFLLFDAPYQIIICNAVGFINYVDSSNNDGGDDDDDDVLSKNNFDSAEKGFNINDLSLPKDSELFCALEISLSSNVYRSPPPIVYSGMSGIDNDSDDDDRQGYVNLLNSLVEDLGTTSLDGDDEVITPTFKLWKEFIASKIYLELTASKS